MNENEIEKQTRMNENEKEKQRRTKMNAAVTIKFGKKQSRHSRVESSASKSLEKISPRLDQIIVGCFLQPAFEVRVLRGMS